MAFFNEFPHTRNYDSDLGWIIARIKDLLKEYKSIDEWKTEHKQEYRDLVKKVNGLIEHLVDVIVPWDSSKEYSIYSMVSYEGVNYIAIQDVPVGVMITNEDYWVPANNIIEQINAIGITVDELKKELATKIKYIFPRNFAGVRSGDISLIQTENNNILIDSHLAEAWTDVREFLGRYNVTHIDYMFITHFHIDHSGNITNLIDAGFINENTVTIIAPDCRQYEASADISSEGARIKAALEDAGINPVIAYDNLSYNIDDLILTIFNANPSVFNDLNWSNDYNECSYIIKTQHGSIESLYTADAGRMALERAVNQGFIKRTLDMMKIEHHGMNAYGNIIPQFEQFVRPRLAFLPLTTLEASYNSGNIGTTTQYIASYGGAIYAQNYNDANDIIFESTATTMNALSGVTVDNIANFLQEIDLYVDAAADGLMLGTQARPFKQVRQAIAYCRPYVGVKYHIHIADGTYDENELTGDDYNAFGNFVGINAELIGNDTTPENVIVKTTRLFARDSILDIHGITFEMKTTSGSLAFSYCHSYITYCRVQGAAVNSVFVEGGEAMLASCNIADINNVGIAMTKNARVTQHGCTFSGTGTAIRVADGSILQTKDGIFNTPTGIVTSDYAVTIDEGYRLPLKSKTITLNANVLVPAGGDADFAVNYDMTSDADGGKVLAAIFEWSSGSLCYCPNIIIIGENLLNGKIRNPSSNAFTVAQVRVRILYM